MGPLSGYAGGLPGDTKSTQSKAAHGHRRPSAIAQEKRPPTARIWVLIVAYDAEDCAKADDGKGRDKRCRSTGTRRAQLFLFVLPPFPDAYCALSVDISPLSAPWPRRASQC